MKTDLDKAMRKTTQSRIERLAFKLAAIDHENPPSKPRGWENFCSLAFAARDSDSKRAIGDHDYIGGGRLMKESYEWKLDHLRKAEDNG